MRVVSLLPSATEICYALGVEPAAVSHECDHPPAARERPTVVRSRVDDDAGSAGIHEQVQALSTERGGGVYEIDLEALRAADPDLVLTQGVCEVCAVDRVLVADALDRLEIDARVVTLDPHSLTDVFADVERVGEATGHAARADRVVSRLRERVQAVERRVSGASTRRVTVLDWLDPPMVAGHWVPDLVGRAGGAYGLADTGERSTARAWTEIRDYDPEVLVAAPCGFDLEQTAADVGALTGREGWDDLTAVREGAVYAMDGHDYVNRPGPRLVDTMEHLAALLHPGRFDAPPPTAARPLADLGLEA